MADLIRTERYVNPNGTFTTRFFSFLTGINNDVTIITTDQTIVTNSITSSDSPYSVVNKYARIEVDASGGQVTVNLLPVASDIYCNVIKTDSSANKVIVSSSDNINGQTTQELLYQYESIEMGGSSEYNVL